MTEKAQIIRELGNKELLLPALINEALSANDRVKYYFTLFQTAKSRADNPDVQFPDLKDERLASGIQDSGLDSAIGQSSKVGEKYKVPHAAEIYEEIKACVKTMMAPLPDPSEFRNRLEVLTSQASAIEGDMILGNSIDDITSVQQGDSIHMVVMDMHRELNKLQSSIYADSIDGAKIFGISDDSDKLSIKAFMRGINKTARLKFDHPGLGTTATKSGDSLIIQNDIGTTDAHVLVVRVRDLSASTTYTDVHIERLTFFQSLFEQSGVIWSDATSKKNDRFEGGSYFLTVGSFKGRDHHDLENYLAFLGSRIVFLIDWNRARKRLQTFVKKDDAIMVLKWAADNDLGHMAFLKLGGESLVIDSIEKLPNAQLRYGQKLDDVLGRGNATNFLKFVLKVSTEGMLDGKSELFIRDEIRVELAKYFHGIHENLLEIAKDHAEMVVEISTAARDAVLQLGVHDPEFFNKTLRRAKIWEKRADDQLNKARQIIRRSSAPLAVERFIGTADDAADSMEEVVFLLTLVTQGDQPGFYEPLRELAELAHKGSMEYLKSVEGARMVRKAGREEMNDFLAAVDMTDTIEHQADDAYRKVKAALINEARDFRQLHLFGEIAAKAEQGVDGVRKATMVLRDYVLEEVVAAH